MPAEVYLDYNATAPLRPEAEAAMLAALKTTGNPSSVHGFGRRARRLVEDAREAVAALVGAPPASVVFTSGGSEANNLALSGLPARRFLVSAIEHDSVLRPLAMQSTVAVSESIPVDSAGVVDLAAVEAALARSPEPTLISVMLANNETGTIQPVAEISALARRHGALVHCDAVQAADRLAIDLGGLGVAALTLSAHKLGGPLGAGALILAPGVELKPQILGGGQERRRRAGTENVPAIAGFGAAARAALAGFGVAEALSDLRDAMEARVTALAPEVRIFGVEAPRLANTSCIAVPDLPAETQVMALDLAGVAVGAGAACSSGKMEPSHVLRAMGAEPDLAASAIRVSLGWATTASDIDRFFLAWEKLYRRRQTAPAA